jgi:predicted TIM-barrel fold metal-dependent hydrolase
VQQAQGFDAASTLTAMDIEGIDVAVMYGTRGRQVLSHDNLPPDYAATLARAYNNWTHDYCAHDPTRLKFAGQVAMHDIPSAIAEARRCVTELGGRDHRHPKSGQRAAPARRGLRATVGRNRAARRAGRLPAYGCDRQHDHRRCA